MNERRPLNNAYLFEVLRDLNPTPSQMRDIEYMERTAAMMSSRFLDDLKERYPRRSSVDFDVATRRPLGPQQETADAEG